MGQLNNFFHRWLRIPYTLHTYGGKQLKRSKPVVVFLHGIGNSGEVWEDVIKLLPKDTQVVNIDLLGFGQSPHPARAKYNAKTQARSVFATLMKQGIKSRAIFVGHSVGSLVAIEYAKRYPLFTKSLILCSPPLYVSDESQHLLPRPDKVLRSLYNALSADPERVVKWSKIAMKYQLINKSFNVTDENVSTYIATLKAMVINQTSFYDALRLRVPTHIIRGVLDPFVLAGNIKQLTKQNPHITSSTVLSGHEITGLFTTTVVKQLAFTIQRR